ncbi:MAG: type II toxin-antitoxin system VapC family toxin [Armatimonadetes bacterium]|nr:type II toxin-antitoxin system VapC family toxin [Armatimonadota bacterium]
MSGYLLDTHTLLWFDGSPARLTNSTRALLETTNEIVYISAMSLWEMGIKYRAGKFPEAADMVERWFERTAQLHLKELALTSLHAREAALLEWEHKDPFDRALAAQSRVEHLTLVTADQAFSTLSSLKTLW